MGNMSGIHGGGVYPTGPFGKPGEAAAPPDVSKHVSEALFGEVATLLPNAVKVTVVRRPAAEKQQAELQNPQTPDLVGELEPLQNPVKVTVARRPAAEKQQAELSKPSAPDADELAQLKARSGSLTRSDPLLTQPKAMRIKVGKEGCQEEFLAYRRPNEDEVHFERITNSPLNPAQRLIWDTAIIVALAAPSPQQARATAALKEVSHAGQSQKQARLGLAAGAATALIIAAVIAPLAPLAFPAALALGTMAYLIGREKKASTAEKLGIIPSSEKRASPKVASSFFNSISRVLLLGARSSKNYEKLEP